MESFIPILFIALLFGGALYYQHWRSEKWKQIAASLGFDHVGGGLFSRPSMSGTRDDIQCVVDIEVRGSGKHKRTYTRMSAHVPGDLPPGLVVSKEGMLSGIGKFFGAQDIEIGDQTFDDACLIKGDDVDGVIVLFQDPKRRNAVWDLVHAGVEGSLRSNQAVILINGFSTNESVISMHLDDVVGTAKALAGGIESFDLGEPETFDAELERIPSEEVSLPEPEVAPTAPEPTPAGPRVHPAERLADRSLGYAERRSLIESLGTACRWTVEVHSAEKTTALGLEAPYKDGETAIGAVGELEVALRFGGEAPKEGTVEVTGRLIDWDDFYRRAIVEVDA